MIRWPLKYAGTVSGVPAATVRTWYRRGHLTNTTKCPRTGAVMIDVVELQRVAAERARYRRGGQRDEG